MFGILDDKTTDDAFRTLYGHSAEEMKEGENCWDTPLTLDLFFVLAENPEQVFPLEMTLPMAQMVATKESWYGFQDRMAAAITEQAGKTVRRATTEEVEAWHKRSVDAAEAAEFARMPPVGRA